MPITRPSMSICTPRAAPNFGRNCEYGKFEPTMSNRSQSRMSSYEGRVPSRPIDPVTYGRSSGSTSLPSNAFATPAPSRSATSRSSVAAPRAPWPTRIATFEPEFSTSAARRTSSLAGTTHDDGRDGGLDGMYLNSCFGGSYSSSCTSFGMISTAGARSAWAVRIARSSAFGSCSGTVTSTRYEATSRNSECRSTSC